MTHLSTSVEIAAALRARAGLTKAPYSTSTIIEHCFPDILVTGFRLPAGVDELVTVAREGPVILYSRALPILEQRYAIAHALAHLIFDDKDVCMRVGRAGVAANEQRADDFGAELLAPLTEVAALARLWPSQDAEDHEIYLDHVDQIASRFSVPSGVIDSQIRRLGVTCKIVSHEQLTIR